MGVCFWGFCCSLSRVLSAQRGWIHLPSSGHQGLSTWEGFPHPPIYAVLWELTGNLYGELHPLWYMQEATAHTGTGQWPIFRTLWSPETLAQPLEKGKQYMVGLVTRLSRILIASTSPRRTLRAPLGKQGLNHQIFYLFSVGHSENWGWNCCLLRKWSGNETNEALKRVHKNVTVLRPCNQKVFWESSPLIRKVTWK